MIFLNNCKKCSFFSDNIDYIKTKENAMADNREHDRDFLKHVEIIKPPFADLANVDRNAGCNSFPAWVGEACVGLIFDPARLAPDEKRISILPDDWILALMRQDPQDLSNMAALWMHYNVFWGGGISTSIENIKILGKGRLMEKGQKCYLPTIHMKIRSAGSVNAFIDGDVCDVDEYEIIELIGRRLPPLEYEHACLPLDTPRMDRGMSKWEVIHKEGNIIDEFAVRALQKMDVEIICV